MTNAFNKTVYSLTAEVDYWRKKFEEERLENMALINQQLENSQKGIANALLFALSVRDDENGNLVINKDDRKTLAENWG